MQKPFLEVAITRADAVKKLAMQHDLVRPDYRANLATSLIAPFSHIGIDDGETSTGRQKLRVPTPQELVDRVLTTTELLIAGFEQRGWLVEVPPFSTFTDDGPPTGFRG
jgi:hypothetical protein